MIRQLLILIVLYFLTSCSANYFITIKSDNTASVNIDRDPDLEDINRHYQSNVISNIDTTISLHSRVSFEISNIDSLGNYLPFHPQGFFDFEMLGDTLIISDSHTEAFKQNDPFCCAVYMTVKLDKDILKIESENRLAKQKDKRTILIKKLRKQFIKHKKPINIKIITTGGNSK